ncbi:MAG: iron-containing alcohol dehydrogenase [Bacteroidota bacterium]
MIPSFQFNPLPLIIFGPGKRANLPAEALRYGKRVLLLTGSTSIHNSGHGEEIISGLKNNGFTLFQETIAQEPSPELVDRITGLHRNNRIEVVIAVGGGSVMDAGKAISALLPVEHGAKRYLEGVGDLEHPGLKVPFIAMPTTSGTGSEMTKNAVLSEVGESGFKKSLRHDNFIPDTAIIDPEMMLSCPAGLTASSGMDTFTQLLEAYLSQQSNPFTDALALQGLKQVKKYLIRAYLEGDQNLEARAGMALASMFSGISLTHAGLGLVHGFASPLGAYHNIPHGIVCGSLLAPVNAATIDKIADHPDHMAYQKYLVVSKVFSDFKYKEEKEYLLAFKDKLVHISNVLEIPSLKDYGVSPDSIGRVVAETSHKNHPVVFNAEELASILTKRL